MQADLQEREVLAAAPLRKAAMFLHSMGEADRRWMLARLDAAQRPRIEALLDELRVLEFPADAALVRESLADTAAGQAEPSAPLTGLSGWSVEQAVQVLLQEPDDVVALVLRAGDWPWTSGLRARLGAERDRRVEESRFSVAAQVPAAVLESVMQAARDRFAALRDETPASRLAKAPIVSRRTP